MVWAVLWVTFFVYIGALALKKKAVTNFIEKLGGLVAAVLIFMLIVEFFFGVQIYEDEGFLHF